MKRILFSIVALVGLGFAASPAMAHGHYSRRVCVPVCSTPVVSTCLPTVTCTPAPVITQPCAPVVTNCAPVRSVSSVCAPVCAPTPVCAPVTYYHTYRVSHWGHYRRCR